MACSELIVADIPEDRRRLLCVQYPGIVDSDSRAISSLGGMEAIANACFKKNSRLEVRFRPEDMHCKPAIGRTTGRATSLVLRVKRRRRKRRQQQQEEGEGEGMQGVVVGGGEEGKGEGEETDGRRERTRMGGRTSDHLEGSTTQTGYEYSAEVIGIVDTTFEFPAMADFQALPPGLSRVMHKAQQLNPKSFQVHEPISDFKLYEDIPCFLPPRIFSKFDRPIDYAFRPDVRSKALENSEKVVQLSAVQGRLRRANYSYGISYQQKGAVPTKPNPDAPDSNHPKLEALKQLFEERPVWSRSALQAKLKLPQTHIKGILALVSYYFTSGPWKTLWVKFGYDPRADPQAKIYQCIDFRLPKEIEVVEPVRYKRTRSIPELFQLSEDVGGSSSSSSRPQQAASGGGGTTTGDVAVSESVFIFSPDTLPGQRQVYYQLCDLRDDALQRCVHSNDGSEPSQCSESSGWCADETYAKLRKLLAEMTIKTAKRKQ